MGTLLQTQLLRRLEKQALPRRHDDLHRWIDRDEMISLLDALGFDDIRIAHDDPERKNGPLFSFSRGATDRLTPLLEALSALSIAAKPRP